MLDDVWHDDDIHTDVHACAQEESVSAISCRTVEVQYLLRQRNLSFTIPHKITWRTKVPAIENKSIVSIVPKTKPAFSDPNFLLKDL